MELLKQVTHIDIRHVPYRGSAGAAQDIVGGHVPGGFLSRWLKYGFSGAAPHLGVFHDDA
jgi:tripartite-type tricarboxylate transporter receptor subunit TctC